MVVPLERPHNNWTVTAAFKQGEDDVGFVSVTLSNGRLGDFPSFDLGVDWKPGMEPVDVEVQTLGIMAESFLALARECIALGVRKTATFN